MSRATARSDRFAPSVSRCRRAIVLISPIISARTRARIEGAAITRLLHTFESTALASAHRSCATIGHNREHCSRYRARSEGDRHVTARDRRSRRRRHRPPPRCWPSAARRVRLVTRRGTGPEHPAIERVAADATDADRLAELAKARSRSTTARTRSTTSGSTDWPPLAASLLTAAERSEATLVTMSNLYGYGPVDGADHAGDAAGRDPPEAADPRRHVARRAGRPRGRPDPGDRGAGERLHRGQRAVRTGVGKPLLKGSAGYSIAPLDVPHSWTSITDAARTLVTVATDERAWGQAWLCPSNPADDRPRSWRPGSPRSTAPERRS